MGNASARKQTRRLENGWHACLETERAQSRSEHALHRRFLVIAVDLRAGANG
jgi:hypothetical protein